MPYREVAIEENCCERTIQNKIKKAHQKHEENKELQLNLITIFDKAENDEAILRCKVIKDMLLLIFNFKISIRNLYYEIRKISSFNVRQLFLLYH